MESVKAFITQVRENYQSTGDLLKNK